MELPGRHAGERRRRPLRLPDYTYDADNHRYVTIYEEPDPYRYTIYMQWPGSDILKPVFTFNQYASDFFMDASHNVWEIALDSANVIEYKLTDYATDGTPQYDAGTRFGLPPQLPDSRRIDVQGDGSPSAEVQQPPDYERLAGARMADRLPAGACYYD